MSTLIDQLRRGTLGELKPAQTMELARAIQDAGELGGLQELRLAFLSSFSFDFAEPDVVVEGARRGLALRTYYGPFAQFEQELVDHDGALARFDADALVLAMRPEDIEPDAVFRYHASGGQRFAELAQELTARLVRCVRMFRSRSQSPVLVANFATPAHLPLGVFDANAEGSLTYALADANQQLRASLAESPDVVVWDYAGLVRNQGTDAWTDPRMMALARVPIARRHQPAMARHLVRTLSALLRPPAKCLVLDLDNTLWGGVVGDDGVEGIVLGDEYPGLAYKQLQRAALALRDRGILLAAASKNDLQSAEQVLRGHPEMLIRWEDFSAVRINWQAKSQNLLEIAAELNLGSDAVVLFDDNPVERAEVRANAPQIRVIEVPTDPIRFEAALAECHEFDTVTLTHEDSVRHAFYRQEGQRTRFEERVGSVEEFLQGLGMQAVVGRLDPSTSQRIAQLVAKTNQFNLTTRRHGRAQLDAMAGDADHVVVWLRLGDRYGDAGLVAVGILAREGDAAVIDTLLMSCRVMGRSVEEALVAHLVEEAIALGCTKLLGDYLPTEKNGVVAGLYADLGFERTADLPDGGIRYLLDLRTSSVPWPEPIRRAAGAEERDAPDAAKP